jgi:hypothetical protein
MSLLNDHKASGGATQASGGGDDDGAMRAGDSSHGCARGGCGNAGSKRCSGCSKVLCDIYENALQSTLLPIFATPASTPRPIPVHSSHRCIASHVCLMRTWTALCHVTAQSHSGVIHAKDSSPTLYPCMARARVDLRVFSGHRCPDAHPFWACSSLLPSSHLSRARSQAWYCSVECQKVHWKEGGHKKVCKATQAVVSKVVAPRGAAGATGFSSPALASGGATTAKKPSSSTTSASQSDGGVCTICLESDPPPIQSGCACRGDAGLAHIECRISAAAAKHQSTGNPAWWSKCTTCNEGLNGEIALGLAQEFYRRMQGHPDKEWGFAAIVLSNALGKVGKDAEAETLCRESLSVLEQPGRGGPAAAQLLRDLRCQLAHALANQGKHAEALPIEECCFEEALLQDGPDDATTLVSAKSIANFLIALDRNAEATTLLLDTYARAKREFGAERSFTLEIGVDLARSLMGSGKEAEGQAMLEELLPVLKRVLGPEHHVYLQSTRMYATSVFNSGRFVEGEAMLADVLKAEMRVLGDEHPQTRSTAETLAHVRKNLVRLGVHLAEAQRMQPAAHTTQ